jgi:hypothetical protein
VLESAVVLTCCSGPSVALACWAHSS